MANAWIDRDIFQNETSSFRDKSYGILDKSDPSVGNCDNIKKLITECYDFSSLILVEGLNSSEIFFMVSNYGNLKNNKLNSITPVNYLSIS